MTGRISIFREQFFGHAVGLIFALALFILHHAALQIEFLLIEHAEQMSHAIAFGK